MILDYNAAARKLNLAITKENQPKPAKEKRAKLELIKDQHLLAAFNQHVEEEKRRQLFEVVDRLACNQENLAPLEQYTQAITGTLNPLVTAVLANGIAQVKAKMSALPVKRHMMIDFRGPQGGGKSTAMKKLLSPVNEYQLDCPLDLLVDTNTAPALEDNFVAFIDELTNAEKTDINALKRIITAEWLDRREFFRQRLAKTRQNCTFFATSNRHINDVIRDDQMRRFFEVQCPPLMDWEAINNIDYLELWRGIDPNKDYLAPFAAELKLAQEKLCTKDDIATFIEEFDLIPPLNEKPREVTVKELYGEYLTWARVNHLREFDSSWFSRKLQNAGVEAFKNKKDERCFKVRQFGWGALHNSNKENIR